MSILHQILSFKEKVLKVTVGDFQTTIKVISLFALALTILFVLINDYPVASRWASFVANDTLSMSGAFWRVFFTYAIISVILFGSVASIGFLASCKKPRNESDKGFGVYILILITGMASAVAVWQLTTFDPQIKSALVLLSIGASLIALIWCETADYTSYNRMSIVWVKLFASLTTAACMVMSSYAFFLKDFKEEVMDKKIITDSGKQYNTDANGNLVVVDAINTQEVKYLMGEIELAKSDLMNAEAYKKTLQAKVEKGRNDMTAVSQAMAGYAKRSKWADYNIQKEKKANLQAQIDDWNVALLESKSQVSDKKATIKALKEELNIAKQEVGSNNHEAIKKYDKAYQSLQFLGIVKGVSAEFLYTFLLFVVLRVYNLKPERHNINMPRISMPNISMPSFRRNRQSNDRPSLDDIPDVEERPQRNNNRRRNRQPRAQEESLF